MNGDTTKPQIGCAQTYFAIQARKQEIQEQLTEEDKRLALRQRVRDANRNLNGVAKSAGVQRFDIFNDAGYKGLYGDIGVSRIKAVKGIEASDDLLDRCGRAELAMNEFRITQTEQKLVRDKIKGQMRATETHHGIGRQVRDTVKKIGGTMPEHLRPEPSLKKIEAARKKSAKLSKKANRQIAAPNDGSEQKQAKDGGSI